MNKNRKRSVNSYYEDWQTMPPFLFNGIDLVRIGLNPSPLLLTSDRSTGLVAGRNHVNNPSKTGMHKKHKSGMQGK